MTRKVDGHSDPCTQASQELPTTIFDDHGWWKVLPTFYGSKIFKLIVSVLQS